LWFIFNLFLFPCSDFGSLFPRAKRGGYENVLNGIALGTDHLLITGKNWDRMFKITLGDWPSLFANKDSGAQIASVVEEGLNDVEAKVDWSVDIVAENGEEDAETMAQAEQEEQSEEDNQITESEQEEEVEGALEELEEETAEINESNDNTVQAQNTISTAYSVLEKVTHDRNSFT
jgi:hypothetical protein